MKFNSFKTFRFKKNISPQIIEIVTTTATVTVAKTMIIFIFISTSLTGYCLGNLPSFNANKN